MLRIEHIQKSYGSRVLLSEATYQFPSGERIALVGANGAGKTTLLNILCGLEAPDSGRVIVPGLTTIGYLPQNPNPSPEHTVLEEAKAGAKDIVKIEKELKDILAALTQDPHNEKILARYEQAEAALRIAGGYAIESKTQSILRGLGFREKDLNMHPTALSGGWRMRLELARLFLSNPDFLILDEPTNHLDLPSLVWVEAWLMNFKGTLLFVSHDRALLNRLATYTVHLHQGLLNPYRGNFDSFLEQREAKMEQEQATLAQLRRRREAMEQFVQRFGAKATKATQAQSRLKMIARIRDLEENLGDSSETTDSHPFIEIPTPQKTPRIVYELTNGAIGYSQPLATQISLTLEKGQRVAVIGANGIGKSTLLRTIAGRQVPLAGEFTITPGVRSAYFAQNHSETLDMDDTVLANMLRQSGLGEPSARQLLGGVLFRGDDVFKKTKVLSGGELSRLGLACILGQKSGLLLLDEPTNHLDMATADNLAEALKEYEGTVLFVSHDRIFINTVCTHVFAMLPDGRSRLFLGNLDDYVRLASLSGFPNVLDIVENDQKTSIQEPHENVLRTVHSKGITHSQAKERKANIQKSKRRIEQLDREMENLREKLTVLENLMAQLPANEFIKANQIHSEATEIRAHLAAKEEEWIATSEELESL